MLIGEFRLLLPSGIDISYEEGFSPFDIYSAINHDECYLLVPKDNQPYLQGIVIVANADGIRISHHRGWPKGFVSNVKQMISCKSNDKLIKIDFHYIPTDLQHSIIDNLINEIQYKSKNTL